MFADLRNHVDSQYVETRNYVDSHIVVLRNYVDSQIAKLRNVDSHSLSFETILILSLQKFTRKYPPFVKNSLPAR
ncbi:hypothetical protein V6N13_082535 [Hibiscus sabdariffa]